MAGVASMRPDGPSSARGNRSVKVSIAETLRRIGNPAVEDDPAPCEFAFGKFGPDLIAQCRRSIEQLHSDGIYVTNAFDLSCAASSAPRSVSDEVTRIKQRLYGHCHIVIVYAELLLPDRNELYSQLLFLDDEFSHSRRGRLSYVYSSKSIFQHPILCRPERMRKYKRFLIEPCASDRRPSAIVESPRIAAQVMALVERHFGALADGRVGKFRADLSDLFAAGGQEVCGELSALYIDPETGLSFLPKSAGDYRTFVENDGEPIPVRDRDPVRFLLEHYDRYITAGLLYSGHVRKTDPGLYAALRNATRFREKYNNLTELFRAHGVLTPIEMAAPPARRRRQVETISVVNRLLAGNSITNGIMQGNAARLAMSARPR